MKVLLIGYSSIARRRVLPALDGMGFEGIDIATGRPDAVDAASLNTPVRVFSGYQEGIAASRADICCISTVNSAHYSHARAALESGKHTVVDKPITLSLTEARSLADLSRTQGLMLAESVVYPDHARFTGTLARLSEGQFIPRHISAVFCFPPLPDDNFRYHERLGGGAPADLGAYAVSPSRCIFGTPPRSVSAWVTERRGNLPIGMRIAALYDEGRTFSGYYSFNAEYQNEIRITGTNFYAHMDRFFTTPGNLETHVRIRAANRDDEWRFPPHDAFAAYLNRIRSVITGTMPNREREEKMELERRKMLDDQEALAMLRSALTETPR